MSEQAARTLIADLNRQTAQRWHIPDEVRVGVLAGTEEYETWLQAHFLRCRECLEPLLGLFDKLEATSPRHPSTHVACAQARNAVFHYLETGRDPSDDLLRHLVTCDACSQPFYEPAKNRVVLEFDPDETGEAG